MKAFSWSSWSRSPRPKPSDQPDAFSTIEEGLITQLNDDILSSFSLALRQSHDVTLKQRFD